MNEVKGRWLFPAMMKGARQLDRHVSRYHVRDILKIYGKRVGITKRIYPHLLRHSAATYLVNNGVDMFTVQRILRPQEHSNDRRLRADESRPAA